MTQAVRGVPGAKRKLRTGYTTGACAAAAAKAAFIGLLNGEVPAEVEISLPGGERPRFALALREAGASFGRAGVVKDAGDDPDVTHGALVIATVRLLPAGAGVRFAAGEGVGVVTLPGLPLAVGEPAINPGPRLMIRQMLEEVRAAPDLEVEIAIPGGRALAERTMNPRLGIVGGLSVLGTSGIVRPYSCAAWIASLREGVDVARALGLAHIVAATGRTSEKAARALFDLPAQAFIDMGDFVGGLLKYVRAHPVPRLTIAGGPAKLAKLAQGALDLHSKRATVDMAKLARWCDEPAVAAARTVAHALRLAPDLAAIVARRALITVRDVLRHAPVRAEVLLASRDGRVLARAGADDAGRG